MLHCTLARVPIPLVVIVGSGAVGDRFTPIPRVKRHAVLWKDFVHRHPPVQLGEWSRIPSVPMWMECVGNPRGQVIGRESGAQPGNIEIGFLQITSTLG